MPPRSDPNSRFWAKVLKTGDCWLWQGSRRSNGYGSFSFSQQQKGMPAHRAAYLLTYGEIPEGKHVLHRCDNRVCVRPDHLYAGTQIDNQRDTFMRHPTARARFLAIPRPNGEQHGHAKLTEAQVLEIRATVGFTYRELAGRYGVSAAVIGDVRRRKTWRHV